MFLSSRFLKQQARYWLKLPRLIPSPSLLPLRFTNRSFSSAKDQNSRRFASSAHPFQQSLSISSPESDKECYRKAASNLHPKLSDEELNEAYTIIDKYTESEESPDFPSHEANRMISVLFQAGNDSSKEMDLLRAVDHYSNCLELAKQHNNVLIAGSSHSFIGSIYLQLQALDIAEKHFAEAWSVFELFPNTAEVLQLKSFHLFNLSILYEDSGKLDQARKLLEDFRGTIDEAGHDFAPKFYGILARVYRKNGQINQAIDCWKKGLDILVKHGEGDSVYAKDFYGNIVTALQLQEQYKEALLYSDQWLRLTIANNESSEKLEEIYVRARTAEICLRAKDFKTAIAMSGKLEKVVKGQKIQNSNAGMLGYAYLCISTIHFSNEDSQKGVKWFEKAMKAIEKAPQEHLLMVAEHFGSFASLLEGKEISRPYARKLCENAESIYKKLDIIDHPGLTNLHYTMGILEVYEKRLEEAILHLRKHLLGLKTTKLYSSGVENVNSLICSLYMELQKFEEAIKFQEETVKACEMTNNASKLLIQHMYLLGELYMAAKRTDDGLRIFQETFEMSLKIKDRDELLRKVALDKALEIMINQGKLDEVERIKKMLLRMHKV